MPNTYKPEGYTSLAPYLILGNAQATIDFLKQVFDAQELRRYDHDDGRVMHAELRIDDTVLMLSDGNDGGKSMPTLVHIYVPNVDATYQRALAAGGRSLQEPKQQGDPDKRAGVEDSCGIQWWFATQIG